MTYHLGRGDMSNFISCQLFFVDRLGRILIGRSELWLGFGRLILSGNVCC